MVKKHQVGGIKCKNCGETFNDKRDLMNHRKCMHPSTVAPCRNKLAGKCDFSDEMYWWSHEQKERDSHDSFKCYICNELFGSKANMMTHRKADHSSIVRVCNKFKQNACKFQNCWYLHEVAMETEDDIEQVDEEEDRSKKSTESVFQKVSLNRKPPINQQKTD